MDVGSAKSLRNGLRAAKECEMLVRFLGLGSWVFGFGSL